MDIAQRLKEAEQKFEQQRNLLAEQETIIKNAENLSIEIRTEMAKLQGEYRLLEDLSKSAKKPNKKATVIDAVPEEK